MLAVRTERATKAQATALALPVRSKVLVLEVLGEAEGLPLHVSERAFPLAPGSKGWMQWSRRPAPSLRPFRRPAWRTTPGRKAALPPRCRRRTWPPHLRQPVNRPVLRVESVNVDTRRRAHRIRTDLVCR